MSSPNIANLAALIADPARAAILDALLDGRAWTATELSVEAGVTPQTTSSHLAKLLDGGMILVDRQGRHRYYRLANAQVAHLLETLAIASGGRREPRSAKTAETQQLRTARTCYDHFAGRLGVGLAGSMVQQGFLKSENPAFVLTETGAHFLKDLGIDVDAARKRRRAFARQCIDWSEREPHMGGALGAALADRLFALNWAARVKHSRRVIVTEDGVRGLKTHFGIVERLAA